MYRVIWEIDIEADSPLAAAKEALAIQRDPQSIATVFLVNDEEIDLGAIGEDWPMKDWPAYATLIVVITLELATILWLAPVAMGMWDGMGYLRYGR
jgi:hypothetical protein